MSGPGILLKLFALVAIGTIFYGFVIIIENLFMSLRGRRAMGRVIDWEVIIETDSEGRDTHFYRPTIQFEADGRRVQFESENRFGERRWKKGTTLPVLYKPSDPERAQLIAGRWMRAVAPFAIGLTMIVVFMMIRLAA